MNCETDCSTTSSVRKPSNWDTASFASVIFPSRSDTNIGSGAFSMSPTANARALSSSRMSRRMPMAPITSLSELRRAEAFSVVGIISPDALRGLRTAFRVTPCSTTSSSASMKSLVSSGEMIRERDCSISSAGRKPSSSKTASFACKIFPSRSETNTGSGALAMMISAAREIAARRADLSAGATLDMAGGGASGLKLGTSEIRNSRFRK